MTGDLSLFGDDEPDEPATRTTPTTTPAASWQVDLLRKALDGRGMTTMAERQGAIEDAIGRPVESLRALTSEEALRALSKLGGASSARSSAATAWDERDEDTWIDRL
ncbi:hypothetical protein, partial [Nocardioides pyridinolyticus]